MIGVKARVDPFPKPQSTCLFEIDELESSTGRDVLDFGEWGDSFYTNSDVRQTPIRRTL